MILPVFVHCDGSPARWHALMGIQWRLSTPFKTGSVRNDQSILHSAKEPWDQNQLLVQHSGCAFLCSGRLVVILRIELVKPRSQA